jgi:hypothetical protein
VVPVLLYFYRWQAVLGVVLAVAFIWRLAVVPFWVAPALAFAGPFFVKLKFISAPILAYLLWQRGDMPLPIAALLWPLVGPPIAAWIMILPTALLSLTPLGKASEIYVVQSRFLLAIGFRPTDP